MTTSTRRTLISLATACAVALPAVTLATHTWGGYHWARTSNPFTVKLGDNLTSNWDPYLATASIDWSLSTVLDTTIVAGQSGKNCRPTAGRVEICNSKYGNNGWLGIAQIWLAGGHITQGAVKMNDSYFTKPAYNTVAWKSLVLCQEVGHIFGLDHQDENFGNAPLGTCMDYSNDPVPNQHPNAHDYEQLETIYAHLDTTSTLGAGTPTGSGNADLHEPAAWGKVLERDARGRPSTFERDLGNGVKVHTFVVWAD